MDSLRADLSTMEEVVENIKSLETVIKKLRDELNEINKPKGLIKSLSEEIEILRKETNTIHAKQEAKIKEYEVKQLCSLKERIENLKKDVSTYQEKNESLSQKHRSEIAHLEKMSEQVDPVDYKALLDTLKQLKDENVYIKSALEKYKNLDSELLDVSSDKENIALSLKYLADEQSELSASSAETIDKLKTAKLALEEEQEQNAIMLSELATLKSGPTRLDDGTSLFYEVEGKRQKLLNNLKILANKYEQMKTVCLQKESEKNRLMQDNAMFQSLLDNDIEQKHFDNEINNTSVQRIKDLKIICSSLKDRPESKKTVMVSEKDGNYSWLPSLLEKYKSDAKLSEERLHSHKRKLTEIQSRHFDALQKQNEIKKEHANLLRQKEEVQLKLGKTD